MKVLISIRTDTGQLETACVDCDLIVVGKNRILEDEVDVRTRVRVFSDPERDVCHELFNHMAQGVLDAAYSPHKQPNDCMPSWKGER